MSEQPLNNEEWFTYSSFLASAARAGLEESVLASSFRFVDAIRQLLTLKPGLKDEPFFREIDDWLDDGLTKAYLMSPEEFTAFLDELLRRFALEARARSGLR